MRVTLRLEARCCHPWDAVPWEQMQDAVPLTSAERDYFNAYTGFGLKRTVTLVRFDAQRIFTREGDLAVCLYNYARSFKPPYPRG